MTEEGNNGGEMVANRLRKNFARLKGWLTQQQIGCYRLYDADLPEYAAAVDIYTTEAGERFAHVQEYQAPGHIESQTVQRRFTELLSGVRSGLNLDDAHIAVKTRSRTTGGSQYGRVAERGEVLVVREGRARLEINLHDYLDTGLFLDHRPVRLAIAERASGARMLNLFSYTGAASVHAALGGAVSTTSVDLSNTYLEWSHRNLVLNRQDLSRHELVAADVMSWLSDHRWRYDLIFCDPPTFSNSKRAADFDVQREHVELLRRCMRCLAPDGVLIFSNNFRRFDPDLEAIADFAQCKETSTRTIDRDFARNPRIHRVFELHHR